MTVVRMHAESGRVELVPLRHVVCGKLFEYAFLDDQVQLVGDVAHQRADQKCAVVDETIAPNDDLHHSLDRLAPSFDLDWDVAPIGHAMEHAIEPAIEQGQKDVQSALRLLDQIRPDLELEALARTARVTVLIHL